MAGSLNGLFSAWSPFSCMCRLQSLIMYSKSLNGMRKSTCVWFSNIKKTYISLSLSLTLYTTSLSLSVSMISGNKDGWYSRLSSVSSCTQGCFRNNVWSFVETPRNLFLKFQELCFVLVDFFEDAVFFGFFGFDFLPDLFNDFKVYSRIFVDDVILFVVADHVDDDLFDCFWYLFYFHFLPSLEGVLVGLL